MPTTHRHIATEWQLRAAEKQVLEAIALLFDEGEVPTLPEDLSNFQIVGCDSFSWVHCDRPGWPEGGYRFMIPYKVGDRIFFAEEWCKGDWGAAFDDDIYFTKSTTPEAENVGWQYASTMPEEAAHFIYNVLDIQVLQMKELRAIAGPAFGFHLTQDGKDISVRTPEYLPEIQAQWEQFFGWSWRDEQYVLVLDLRQVQNAE